MSTLKQRIQDDIKTAMKAQDKPKLGVLRLIMAALKQIEVDKRIELTDEQIIAILDKMNKQRRESISQYEAGGREKLAAQEQFEIDIIQSYLPEPLAQGDLDQLIAKAIAATAATSIKDMGKVMAMIRPKVQGRADMASVSAAIKAQLSGH